MPLLPIEIAQVCHEANRVFCESLGDFSQPDWDDAPLWQKESAVAGVIYRVASAFCTASDLHEAWSEQKIKDGWTYGRVKNAEKKFHPCLLPYADLPASQQVKDKLFSAIVDSLKGRL